MRILILGGTGFIGKPLCRNLAIQGRQTAVFSRGQKSVDLPEEAHHIKADRRKLAEVAS